MSATATALGAIFARIEQLAKQPAEAPAAATWSGQIWLLGHRLQQWHARE
jgi:hypothetical protein